MQQSLDDTEARFLFLGIVAYKRLQDVVKSTELERSSDGPLCCAQETDPDWTPSERAAKSREAKSSPHTESCLKASQEKKRPDKKQVKRILEVLCTHAQY